MDKRSSGSLRLLGCLLLGSLAAGPASSPAADAPPAPALAELLEARDRSLEKFCSLAEAGRLNEAAELAAELLATQGKIARLEGSPLPSLLQGLFAPAPTGPFLQLAPVVGPPLTARETALKHLFIARREKSMRDLLDQGKKAEEDLRSLSYLCAGLKRWPEAAQAARMADHAHWRYLRQVLPIMYPSDQAVFLYYREIPSVHATLQKALQQRSDPQWVEFSAELVLNTKGLAEEGLTELTRLARESNDPKVGRLARELEAIRVELACSALQNVPAGSTIIETMDGVGKSLEEYERQLTGELVRAVARQKSDDPWAGLDAVRKALSQDQVLIELARFPWADSADRSKQAAAWRYAAWMIPPAGQGKVQLVDLGDAGPIDRAVGEFRRAMHAAMDKIALSDEAEAEKAIRPSLEALAKLLLPPLLPGLKQSRHWIVGPDGGLWLVPWHALCLEDGRYLVEQHTVSHVVSGRELAAPVRQFEAHSAIVAADPDFDAAAAPAKEPAQRSAWQKALRPQDLMKVRWKRLPGTAEEAAAVVPRLAAYLGEPPQVFTGPRANEDVLRAVAHPRFVLFSTHGFFLPDYESLWRKQQRAFERIFPRDEARQQSGFDENPLLRCGLALAGANRHDRRGSSGLLTGMVIAESDLRGTELVVLSACNTGIGDFPNSQSVAGLRQAFRLAGAETIVATLWEIPDHETVELITAFWDRLAAGEDRVTALRGAQLEVIHAHRDSQDAAHPFYWAAFTLTGRSGPLRRLPAGSGKPMVIITSPVAEVVRDGKVLTRVHQSEVYVVEGQRDDRWQIAVQAAGKRQSGWIDRRHATLLPAKPKDAGRNK